MDRMRELVDLLNNYAYQYYVLDNPTIADKQYDELYDELLKLENERAIVLEDSPTKRVGGEVVKEFKQHVHINKLYSLDKCNSFDQLKDWDAKLQKNLGQSIEYTLEYKYDGLTLCLTYENGFLKIAATRGNGVVGEDVTNQVTTIRSIPTAIAFKGILEAQGEGIMRLSALEAYNKEAKEPLKNARNGVAGAIRNLDPKVTASRNLDIIFYNVNYAENESLQSQKAAIEFLDKNRFKTSKIFVNSSMDEIIEIIKNTDRTKLDYLIDGMVIKVNSIDLRERLGYTDKFPRWAMAYKFEAEETTTILNDVIWQVGRTGKLTPLAMLQPVELCGATIQRATLNNFGDITRKNVKIGSSVFLRRSNDVIPEILGMAEDNGGTPIELPTHCPACNCELIEDGAHIFCPNEYNCPPQIIGRIVHFASKECMDIDGISDKTVEQLYHKLGINSVAQLYDIKAANLENLDSFKAKKIENFIAAVEKSKAVDLPHFINALSISNIGRKTARDLAAKFGNIDALKVASRDELLAIPEIGDIMADSIIDYFGKHSSLIKRFKELGIDPQFNVVKSNAGIFFGKNIVLTGILITMGRNDATKIIESLGGITQSAVTKETDFVVAGEKAGSKLEKAKKLGKKILDENEFISLINT